MLELEAVCRTIAYFLPALQNQNVLLRCDNTTVVQYINKQGGTKSVSLCYKVWELFKMTIGHGIQIKAAHLSGHHNMLADRLSCPIIRPTEWTLNNRVLNKLFCLRGKPMIDLFASEDNNKMQVFCTWFPSQKAYAVDALVNSLEQHGGVCISSDLSCSQSLGAHVSISVPDTINSTSVAKTPLVHKSVTKAHRLSKKTSHTKQSSTATQNNDLSSNTTNIQSHCMAAFNRNFKSKGFSKETRKLLTASLRAGTQQDYACKFKKFNSWCSERQKDPYSATLVDCADFLTYLFNSGLQYRTIAGYRSMLSSVLLPIDNTPVGQHPYIIHLF